MIWPFVGVWVSLATILGELEWRVLTRMYKMYTEHHALSLQQKQIYKIIHLSHGWIIHLVLGSLFRLGWSALKYYIMYLPVYQT